MNGIQGSHHYFLNLIMEEVDMVVTANHDIIEDITKQLRESYTSHHEEGRCLCRTCASFGPTYSVLSLCEVHKLKEHKRSSKYAAEAATHGQTILSDVASCCLEPTEAPMEVRYHLPNL